MLRLYRVRDETDYRQEVVLACMLLTGRTVLTASSSESARRWNRRHFRPWGTSSSTSGGTRTGMSSTALRVLRGSATLNAGAKGAGLGAGNGRKLNSTGTSSAWKYARNVVLGGTPSSRETILTHGRQFWAYRRATWLKVMSGWKWPERPSIIFET